MVRLPSIRRIVKSMIGKPIMYPTLSLLAHTLLDRRDVFLRNVTALDLVFEDDALAALTRSDDNLGFTKLTRTTRLLLVRVGRARLRGRELRDTRPEARRRSPRL